MEDLNTHPNRDLKAEYPTHTGSDETIQHPGDNGDEDVFVRHRSWLQMDITPADIHISKLPEIRDNPLSQPSGLDSVDRRGLLQKFKCLGRRKSSDAQEERLAASSHTYGRLIDLEAATHHNIVGDDITHPPALVNHRRPASDNTHMYNMSHVHRGICVIINVQNNRPGSDVDARLVSECFNRLGFDITYPKTLTAHGIMQTLTDVSRADHTDVDCLVCVVMSHGEAGLIYSSDGRSLYLENIFSLFKGSCCRSLAGKPKLFFVQACRGEKTDEGVRVLLQDENEEDSVDMIRQQNPYKIPIEADCLYAYATVPGYLAWRNATNGSWFIQGLYEVLGKFGLSKDILAIMTRVSQFVAHQFETSNEDNAHYHEKKQMPCVVSTLTKELIFTKTSPMSERIQIHVHRAY